MRRGEGNFMPGKYNIEETEKIVERLWKELEPKIVKSICEEFKLDESCDFLNVDELRRKCFGIDFCHILWRHQKKILKRDYNIYWKSPAELDPKIRFF